MTLELSVPVTGSPVAALLAAFGVARWLESAARDLSSDPLAIEIVHGGDRVILRVPSHITPDRIAAAGYQKPAFQWILTAKNGPAPAHLSIFDYEAERSRNTEYFARRDALRKAGTSLKSLLPEQQREIEELEPRPEWSTAVMLNQMGALKAYNKAVERWAACRTVYPELVTIIWTMTDGQPEAIDRAQTLWERLAKECGLEKNATLTATQVVNPEQGKGANYPKANKLSIGGQDSFWLLEYFKFAGLYIAALPRTVREKKDRKTYVVVPSRQGLLLRWHRQVFERFHKELYSTSAIKMDILAALHFTRVMLEQWQEAQQSLRRSRRRPSDFVEGLAVVSYKDLGSAFAVMNVATIGLPEWTPWPESAADAAKVIAAIQEHEWIIGAIGRHRNEEKPTGDEEQLLRDYRDFLSDRDPSLRAFFRFIVAYAGYRLREQARGFTTTNLEVIIMAQETERQKKFKPIIENLGFQRIARAIRQSTVTQQYWGDNLYDVRYGLADELHRHSRDKADFLRALSKFLQEYSQENARVLERARKQGRDVLRKRVAITHEDIAQLVALVDEYDAATIASLLIAFGYARETGSDDGKDTPQLEEQDAAE